VVVNLVIVIFLRYLKGISFVEITHSLEIPEYSGFLRCCVVLPGNSLSTF
jgi:hypothetical protein